MDYFTYVYSVIDLFKQSHRGTESYSIEYSKNMYFTVYDFFFLRLFRIVGGYDGIRGACCLCIQRQNHFVPKDEGGIFLQGIGLHLEGYVVSPPRRLQSKTILIIKPTRCTNFSNLF